MGRNDDYIIVSSTNDYVFLKQAFENYEEGNSKFEIREYIMELMLRKQENIRNAKMSKAKGLGLKPEDKKNNSNN